MMNRPLLALCLGSAILAAAPARAALPVFDPTNYAQNVLTAARTLEQINNQIRSLQNEATMLANMGKNLARLDFPQVARMTQTLASIDRLMADARGLDFRVDTLDARVKTLFPGRDGAAATTGAVGVQARDRFAAALAAFKQAMGVQAQVVENVRDDAHTLSEMVERSQGAEGALQATQATNQLLALAAKQQFQLQSMMAAQFRSGAVEASRRLQAEAEARAATKRFLGDGKPERPR
jgi:type IV secretion system protein TrbJ